MLHGLITWSDRGVTGPIPAHHGNRPASDQGPIRRLVREWKARPAYASAWVLTTPAGEANARRLCDELASSIQRVECCVLPLSDPSDHGQLFHALRPVIQQIAQASPGERWQHDVLLSAGTPQAQTLWVILVQAGLLRARMLQVIPEVFAPPSPVREVKLNIEGFPEIRALREEVRRLRAEVQWKGHAVIGESPSMSTLLLRATRVAASDLPVLIVGETGTGKELVAHAVHEASERARGPFVAENCAAFAEGLLASELFGHEPGAFTGAVGRKRGLFELAQGGTLFLDEVGDMPLAVQAHLLRVLQEGALRRVGGESMVNVDVRLMAATHRDLQQLCREGRFREDLYYRLRGATLELPPLRERRDDIPLLVGHFLRSTKPVRALEVTPRAVQALAAYRWPGNVRELRSEVARWKVFCGKQVDLADLSPEIVGAQPAAPDHAATGRIEPLAVAVRAAEERAIAGALAREHGNLSRTARALGIDRNTLKRKLATLGLRRAPEPATTGRRERADGEERRKKT